MSKINYPLLRKVREMILKRPMQFEMAGFFQKGLMPLEGFDFAPKPSNCGTSCCIAGWAIALDQMPVKPKPSKANYVPYQEGGDAMALLGLTKKQAERLFYAGSWPQPHRDAYEFAKTYQARAKAGAARVDAFIQSKGRV